MEKLFTVAIVGLGNIAETVHIPYFQQSAKAKVIALCSRTLHKAEAACQKYNIEKFYDNLDDLLALSKPDIVCICLPNAFHYEATMKALQAGCHVFCEKPPAINYMQAKAMEKMAQQMNRILAYNFNYRQKQETYVVQRKIADSFFGKIYHINASFTRRRGIPGWGNFTNKDIQGGGALMDIGIHVLDLAMYLLDYPDVENVLASTYDHIGKQGGTGLMGKWEGKDFMVEDSCFAHIKLHNNISITLQSTFALHTGPHNAISLEIFGSEGGASMFPLTFFTVQNEEFVNIDHPLNLDYNFKKKAIDEFIDACNHTKSNICTAQQGTAIQKLIEDLYYSSNKSMMPF